MNPPDRGSRSSYGGSAQGRHQQAAFPFVVDPTEGPPGASAVAVRAFFQAPEGDREPSSAERQQRYGACRGAQISLGHGMHRYHQFGVEGNQDGGTSGSLPRHSSSPPGFFSSPIVYNAESYLTVLLALASAEIKTVISYAICFREDAVVMQLTLSFEQQHSAPFLLGKKAGLGVLAKQWSCILER